jgi:hypothetical protein
MNFERNESNDQCGKAVRNTVQRTRLKKWRVFVNGQRAIKKSTREQQGPGKEHCLCSHGRSFEMNEVNWYSISIACKLPRVIQYQNVFSAEQSATWQRVFHLQVIARVMEHKVHTSTFSNRSRHVSLQPLAVFNMDPAKTTKRRKMRTGSATPSHCPRRGSILTSIT